MNRSDLIKDMKSSTGSGFITRKELANYLGYRCPKGVDRFLSPLQRIDGTRYFIPDVAESILLYGGNRKY